MVYPAVLEVVSETVELSNKCFWMQIAKAKIVPSLGSPFKCSVAPMHFKFIHLLAGLLCEVDRLPDPLALFTLYISLLFALYKILYLTIGERTKATDCSICFLWKVCFHVVYGTLMRIVQIMMRDIDHRWCIPSDTVVSLPGV